MGLFSGILGSIFGSDPKQIGGGQINTKPVISEEQQQIVDTLLPFFTGTPIESVRAKGAPLGVTGRTDLASSSLAGLEQFVGQLGKIGLGQAGESADIGRTGIRDILTRGPQDIDEYFRTTVQEPALRDFSRDVLPQIARTYGGNQFFSTERRETENRAREDLLRGLTESRSELAYKARQDDTNAMLSAVDRLSGIESLEPTVASAVVDSINKILSGGEIIRGQDTEVETAKREEELRQQSEQDLRIQQLLAFLGIPQVENIAFAPAYSQGKEGIAGQAALMALSAALCWVARAAYGADNPMWLVFRHWLIHESPEWLYRAYMRWGPAFGGWLEGRPAARAVVRWLMNRVISHYGKNRR